MVRKTKTSTTKSRSDPGIVGGWRSGLEEKIAEELREKSIDFTYESHRVEYLKPARKARYTPDFILPNGIVIESKGRFVTADRQKHLLIAQQCPGLDIRFVFSNPNNRISKQSKTTYAMWCEKHDFLYAKQTIPDKWIKEKPTKERLEAIDLYLRAA